MMDSFLEFFKGVLLILIMVVLGIVSVVLIWFGTMYTEFIFNQKADTSYGSVYCDSQKVYEGRLYRVYKHLDTNRFQTPMFSVKITSPNKFYKVEERYFCKDYQVK